MLQYEPSENPGKYVIYSHKNYHPELGLNRRTNARQNVDIIKTTFDGLGFTRCGSNKDLWDSDIQCNLCKVLSSDFSNHGSLFVFILTHGDISYQLAAYNKFYYLKELVEETLPKMHSTLKGKPVIFIIQACNGENYDHGASANLGNIRKDIRGPYGSLFLPATPDLLFFFSSTPGIISFRALFIPKLCQIIQQYHDRFDIDLLFTLTRQAAAEDVRTDDNQNPVKQVPMIVSTLTKKFMILVRRSFNAQ